MTSMPFPQTPTPQPIDAARLARLLPVAALALALAVAIGALAASRPGVALLLPAAGVALVSLRWRAGVLALLALLPFSGAPVFIAGDAGLVARDGLIVLPLYAGFALELTRTRDNVAGPRLGLVLTALAAFAALVVAHVPLAPTALAGAIGAKVWLAYLPMLAVGFVYARTPADVERALRTTALLALVPAALGAAEWWLAVSNGGFGALERLYAHQQVDAAARTVVFTGGGSLHRIPRIPSTFTSVSQYSAFTLVALACALSLALRRRTSAWRACAAALALGSLLSGARITYVAVPALLALALALAGVRPTRRQAAVAVAAALVTLAAAALVAPSTIEIALLMPSHAATQATTATREFAAAARTLGGHGTGWDTNAALRYGGAGESRYVENWYAKSALELGVAGLVALAVALIALHARLLDGLRHLPRETRALAAPVVALLVVLTVASFKGPYLDLDPANAYFWLFAGMLLGLSRPARPVSNIQHPTSNVGPVPRAADGPPHIPHPASHIPEATP